MKRGQPVSFLIPFLLVLGAIFVASYFATPGFTGRQIVLTDEEIVVDADDTPPRASSRSGSGSNIQQLPPQPTPDKIIDCVWKESEIPVAADKKTITKKAFVFCATMTLSHEYIISIPGSKLSCLPNVKLQYDASKPRGQYDGFQIPQGVKDVSLEGCTLEGGFRAGVRNSGEGTKLTKNSFLVNDVGVYETDTAVSGVYTENTVKNAVQKGMVLEGKLGVVIHSTLESNPIGIFIGKEMTRQPVGKMICTQYPKAQQLCSDPASGRDVRILRSTLVGNGIGIQVSGIGTFIEEENTLKKNEEGVLVRAIYTGTVKGDTGNVMDFFTSRTTVRSNTIDENTVAGIHLKNHATETTGRVIYGDNIRAPKAFYAFTTISKNTLKGNKNGLLLDCPERYDVWPQGWGEYTLVDSNQISNNQEHGLFSKCGGDFTYVVYNTILSNNKNGIKIGESSSDFEKLSYGRLDSIYDNDIKKNKLHGVLVESGAVLYAVKNEINDNEKKGIYLPPRESQEYKQASQIVCNDISFNQEEGFYADAKYLGDGEFYKYPDSANLFHSFVRNRVLRNGIANNGDGMKVFLDRPLPSWYTIQYPWIPNHQRVINNHFADNFGYGIHYDSSYGAVFAANNILPNRKGLIVDTGLVSYENMWDEDQYRDFHDYREAQCNVACKTDKDCGSLGGWSGGGCSGGICVCPRNWRTNVPYTCDTTRNACNIYVEDKLYLSWPDRYIPYGNYINGQRPVAEINVQKPPLKACTNDYECMYHNCYKQSNKNVCGDRDEITSQRAFLGFYDPANPDQCPSLSFLPGPPPDSFCGDGAIDAGEECDPAAVPDGCVRPKKCTAQCKCVGDEPGRGRIEEEKGGYEKQPTEPGTFTPQQQASFSRLYPSDYTPAMIAHFEEQRKKIDAALDEDLRNKLRLVDPSELPEI